MAAVADALLRGDQLFEELRLEVQQRSLRGKSLLPSPSGQVTATPALVVALEDRSAQLANLEARLQSSQSEAASHRRAVEALQEERDVMRKALNETHMLLRSLQASLAKLAPAGQSVASRLAETLEYEELSAALLFGLKTQASALAAEATAALSGQLSVVVPGGLDRQAAQQGERCARCSANKSKAKRLRERLAQAIDAGMEQAAEAREARRQLAQALQAQAQRVQLQDAATQAPQLQDSCSTESELLPAALPSAAAAVAALPKQSPPDPATRLHPARVEPQLQATLGNGKHSAASSPTDRRTSHNLACNGTGASALPHVLQAAGPETGSPAGRQQHAAASPGRAAPTLPGHADVLAGADEHAAQLGLEAAQLAAAQEALAVTLESLEGEVEALRQHAHSMAAAQELQPLLPAVRPPTAVVATKRALQFHQGQ